jgi:hypothetical protein
MTEHRDAERISPTELETGVGKTTVYVNTTNDDDLHVLHLHTRLLRGKLLPAFAGGDRMADLVEYRVAGPEISLPDYVDAVIDLEVTRDLMLLAEANAPAALQDMRDARPELRIVLRLVPTDAVQFRTIGATVASAAQTAGLTLDELLRERR